MTTTYQLEETVYSAGPTTPDLQSSPQQRPHLETTTSTTVTSLIDTQHTQHNQGNTTTSNDSIKNIKGNTTTTTTTTDTSLTDTHNTQHNKGSTTTTSNKDIIKGNSSNNNNINTTTTTTNIPRNMTSSKINIKEKRTTDNMDTIDVVVDSTSTSITTPTTINDNARNGVEDISKKGNGTDNDTGNFSTARSSNEENSTDSDSTNRSIEEATTDDDDNDNNTRVSFSNINPPLRLVSLVPDLTDNTTRSERKGLIPNNKSNGKSNDTTMVRQNDGPDRPRCGSKRCGLRKTLNMSPPLLTYPNDDDEDDGVRNLRRILKEAQVTIKRFQIDFEQEGVGKNTSRESGSKWTLLDAKGVTSNFTDDDKRLGIDKEDCEEKTEVKDKTKKEESAEMTEKVKDKENKTPDKIEGGHKIRHHHGQEGLRRHHHKRRGDTGGIEQQETTITSIPPLQSSHTFMGISTPHNNHDITTQSSRYPVTGSSSPVHHSFSLSPIPYSSSTISPTVSSPSHPSSYSSSSPPAATPSSSLPFYPSSFSFPSRIFHSPSFSDSSSSRHASHSSMPTTTPILRLWHTWDSLLLETKTQTDMQNKIESPAETVLENPVVTQKRNSQTSNEKGETDSSETSQN
ncbi:hypothetical protein Pmani_019640 [Petrolisthes manimaculis]|uniref:Uncharacterized protein n=1 Tax=Petrolisthes manimaculis TaxID=1843537 RepID=A0AAE1U7G0_9EUCA|nr:hypothetical protein Pmani_019640 [Petrolisthes manimaculis]